MRRQQGFASDEAALGFVRDSDHERASRMRFLYHVNLDDPLLYDLALNTERVGVEEGVRLVREALQGTIVQPTEASGALARDLSLAAQAKARLFVDPTTRSLRLSVTAAGGDLTVAGMVDSDVLRDAALAILRGIPGAAGVKNEITVVPISRSYVGT